jgi:hypothetical protein
VPRRASTSARICSSVIQYLSHAGPGGPALMAWINRIGAGRQ